MDAARFTYERTAAGWHLQVDEPGLGGPLEGVFRYELRLGDLPDDLAVVGHCRVTGMWCVFAREAGDSVVHGIALGAERYGAHEFDPFAVAAQVLESGSAKEAVPAGADPDARSRPEGSAGPEYLAEARRRFLLGSPSARQTLYCSVLPPGFPRRLSPLSCFVTEGGRSRLGDDPSERARGADPDDAPAASGTPPEVPRPPAPGPQLSQPIPTPPASTVAADAPPVSAHQLSDRERVGDADDELERGTLWMEIDRVERELSRRLRALQTALLLATALLAVALAAALWWTSMQLRRIESGTTATQGAHPPDASPSGRWLP